MCAICFQSARSGASKVRYATKVLDGLGSYAAEVSSHEDVFTNMRCCPFQEALDQVNWEATSRLPVERRCLGEMPGQQSKTALRMLDGALSAARRARETYDRVHHG